MSDGSDLKVAKVWPAELPAPEVVIWESYDAYGEAVRLVRHPVVGSPSYALHLDSMDPGMSGTERIDVPRGDLLRLADAIREEVGRW